jgi:hypothetical protein
MRRKTFRTSFVVTIAGSVVQSAGCGGTAVDHDHDAATGGQVQTGGRSSSGGSGGTGGQAIVTGGTAQGSGGTVSTGGKSVATGGAGALDECPSGSVYSTPAPVCPESGRCALPVRCAGGETLLEAACGTPYAWSTDTPCEHPYDHCQALDEQGSYRNAICFDHSWHLQGIGGNPPSPCAEKAPLQDAPCRPGAFGGDMEYCGYPCSPTSANPQGWSVYHCAPEQPDASAAPVYTWQPDGNCDYGPNGD